MVRTLACLLAVVGLTAHAGPRHRTKTRPGQRVQVCGPIIKDRAHGYAVITILERKDPQLSPSMITTPRRFKSELLNRE